MHPKTYHYNIAPIASDGIDEKNIQRSLPRDLNRIVGWDGGISTFMPLGGFNPRPGGLHVDTYVCLSPPPLVEAEGVFAVLKTGDSGHAVGGLMGLNIDISKLDSIWFHYWAHNMLARKADAHFTYTLYCE